jgi:hypothetical protein
MSSVCGTTISYLGAMSVGAMIDGGGFKPYLGHVDVINATAGGTLKKVENARQSGRALPPAHGQELSSTVLTSIDRIGYRDISGSGALTGSVTDSYESLVGSGSMLTQYKAHINQMFGDNPLHMAQTFSIASSLTNTSAQMAPTLDQLNQGVNFGALPAEFPANGVFPYHLGSGYNNFSDVQTNGVSILLKDPTAANYTKLANDLARIGNTFDIEDISNFGNPGQVIQKLDNLNGLSVCGLAEVLAKLNIDPGLIYNLGDSSYNKLMTEILTVITTPELIQNAQNILTSAVENMTSLASYVDFDIIFVESKDVVSFSTMEEFRTKLQAIELGRITNAQELANYIVSVSNRTLPTIANRTNFVERDFVQPAANKFTGGTGANGRITIVDMIGLLGGIGIQSQVSSYNTAMNALNTAGEFTRLNTLIDYLADGLAGTYTSIIDPLTDPVTISITDGEGGAHGTYDSFATAYIGYIETELANIMSRQNVQPNIKIAIDNYKLIVKKIYNEKDFQSRIDMGYGTRTNFPDIAYTFITGVNNQINDPGRKEIVLGMIEQSVSEGSLAGEYIRAFVNECENRKIGRTYDVRWRAEICE